MSKLAFVFLIGLNVGMWLDKKLNDPNLAAKAYQFGVWTRLNILRLPPIEQPNES